MLGIMLYRLALPAALIAIVSSPACAGESLSSRVSEAILIIEGAESCFQSPDPKWYDTSRSELANETRVVSDALDAQGDAYAAAWKNHLHWPLLVSNLGEPSETNLDQLALVRRWLYSNREGLEYPFFSQLREKLDAHLDAVYTFSEPNLQAEHQRRLVVLRQQLLELVNDPSDRNASALGRTLGWFKKTKQTPEKISRVHSLVSLPNAQIIVTKPLISRVVALLASEVDETLPVSDRLTVQGTSLLSQPRTANVHGTARTHGYLGVALNENSDLADIRVTYAGEIESYCRAIIGPVTVGMKTVGPVSAITPIEVSLRGVTLRPTDVSPEVRTRVTNVDGKNALVRLIGERRVSEPESKRQMSSRARYKASDLLQKEMDERIETAVREIRAEFTRTKQSLDNFQEVLAPIAREGATPRLHGIQSTSDAVVVNGWAGRSTQLGAPTNCPPESLASDVQARFHVSFFNNMGETIMAGKTFTDEYFMNYGKILLPQLPPPLMVHSRSQRWAIVAAKPRPLEISIPSASHFRIIMRMQQVEISGEQFVGSATLTVNYVLTQNEFGEYQLERQGVAQLESQLPKASQDFLLEKFNAFFASTLNGGGVALPEGGTLGSLRSLKPDGVYADRDWLAIGVEVQKEFLEAWIPQVKE
ncbi:hypothetical protein [Adhaeretor mobilis]|uniref:Secreted protein n=1 Tax=Adhaeretor mobilis TaxID=1930276 RepID=A0A517MZS9_9BACT|nr:hypothetical protein [Adhaeretor mobilis]QDT00354.1 hypothetical protein HG15A2_36900 [Adhaeretor mobilis]